MKRKPMVSALKQTMEKDFIIIGDAALKGAAINAVSNGITSADHFFTHLT